PPPQAAAVQVVQTGGQPLTGMVEVGAAYSSTCARDTGGAVWCWGANNRGQLGDNTTSTRATAARVIAVAGAQSLAGATDLVTGGGETWCTYVASGGVVCWGANDSG